MCPICRAEFDQIFPLNLQFRRFPQNQPQQRQVNFAHQIDENGPDHEERTVRLNRIANIPHRNNQHRRYGRQRLVNLVATLIQSSPNEGNFHRFLRRLIE